MPRPGARPEGHNVNIVEFVIEDGLHVCGADDARSGVVLASHPPQFLAFGEGHLQSAVAARNGAFDLNLSGHFANITTTEQGEGSYGRAGWPASSTFASKFIRPGHVIVGAGSDPPSGMAGNPHSP